MKAITMPQIPAPDWHHFNSHCLGKVRLKKWFTFDPRPRIWVLEVHLQGPQLFCSLEHPPILSQAPRFPVDSLKVPPVMLTDTYSQHVHTLHSPSPVGEHWEPPLSLDTTILNPHSPMAWPHPTILNCNVLVDLKTFPALSADSLAPL